MTPPTVLSPPVSGPADTRSASPSGAAAADVAGTWQGSDVVVEAVADGARIRFLRPQGQIEAPPRELGLPTVWTAYAQLELQVVAPARVTLDLVAVLPRGRLAATQRLEPGVPATLVLDLADLPLGAGTGRLYEPVAVRLVAVWEAGDTPCSLLITTLRLMPAAAPPGPVVDAFGQRLHADWPGKVRTAEELVARAAAEALSLAATPSTLPPRDRFGGWLAGPTFAPTGRFRVERDGRGRWWFVTPTGRAFWSLGTTGVRLGAANDAMPAADRRHLFTALPEVGHPAWFTGRYPGATAPIVLAGALHGYRWNVLRKYGSVEAWRERVLARWSAWGFNSFGAWSDELLWGQESVPYTRSLGTRGLAGVEPTVPAFPDVWDPRWEAAVDAEFARQTADQRAQAWLLGYFVDNELPWRESRLLDAAPGACLREAWLAFVRARFASLATFNREAGTACVTWDDVRALRAADLASAARLTEAFLVHYADRYFATVARLLRKHAPDHLYLGCRFVRLPPADGVIAAAGRHVDVLSVNCYSRTPDPQAFADWHRLSGGRPILIGEFHFPLASPRQLPPLWEPFPEGERETMFTTFVERWARQPWSLGCHWYQHADQPVLGRCTDGENQTVGFVDVTDTPYEHLVRAARTAAASMYTWHAAM